MANRYWVGGTASWDATAGTKWALTSGGAGGQTVPTSADDVFFDGASGAVTVTVASASNCLSLNFTGFTGTFAGTSGLTITGNLTLSTGMTRSYTGSITFNSTTTGRTLTFAGKTMFSTTTFNGVGGGWTIQDAWNSGTSLITLTAGNLNTNGQTITCDEFNSSNTNTRVLTLGASTINCRQWTMTTVTGLTASFASSTIVVNSDVSGNFNYFAGGGLTYNIVSVAVTNTNDISGISGANTFTTLTLTNSSPHINYYITGNQTITGTFTVTGASVGEYRILLSSNRAGVPVTISAGTTSLTNVDFKDITGTGSASWTGTSLGNAGGNSGITFTTPVTRYGVSAGVWSATSTWSATSGGASGASVPICHDTVFLNASSGAGTYTIDLMSIASLDCTGFTGTLTFSSPTAKSRLACGNFILNATMTITQGGTPYLILNGRSSYTLGVFGKSFGFYILVDCPGGTYTQNGAMTITNSNGLLLQQGTYTTANFAITTSVFQSSLTVNLIRTFNMGSSIITATSTTTAWTLGTSFNTNCTINAGTSQIILNDGTTSTKTFSGGGKSYNILELTGAGIAIYTFVGNNTFNELKSTKTVAHTLNFTAGSTQTITKWSINGSSGNLVTIKSTTTATHTLIKSGGGIVSADWLNIQQSLARPGAWYAGVNSVNNQAVATAGNGWQFNVPPIPSKNYFTKQAVNRASTY